MRTCPDFGKKILFSSAEAATWRQQWKCIPGMNVPGHKSRCSGHCALSYIVPSAPGSSSEAKAAATELVSVQDDDVSGTNLF